MTRAEILAMQPGPELDIELGKALGAKVRRYRSKSSGNRLYELTLPGWCGSPDWCEESGAWSAMPAFSTSWEGMRLVVEAMRKRGWEWEVSGGSTGETGCGFSRDDDSICKYAEGKDAPHAVAIAALLALEAGQ